MSRRTEKIASQLRGEIAKLLHEEVTDPRVGMVTITRLDVAPDLSNAVVYFSVLDLESGDPAGLEEVVRGLESAAPFLRHRAARSLPLRRMPELRFRYDPSLSLGSRTLSLLRDLSGEESERDSGGGDQSAPQQGSGGGDQSAPQQDSGSGDQSEPQRGGVDGEEA